MRRLLLSLVHLDVMHEIGTGRALDNARREHEEVARTMAVIDALASRLGVPAPVTEPVAA
ncbi:MAG: hypothetical protein QOG65_2468 [Actinomycetota bacterium]|jgi:hypothetical protein|nr:hypothetical protein [Actinomycetota bacterium]